jgi:tetratricopeptide (TPR) repeat protein
VLAETHATRAAALQERVLEATDPDLVKSRILLAAARVSQGRYREMEKPLEELLVFTEEHFTPNHELSIETAYWLSRAYAQVSRADDGEELMIRYLPISQEALPSSHWLRPTIVNERGYYHVAYRRMAEAETFSRFWLARYRAEFGREHPYSIMLMHNLASSLIFQGKYDEAKSTYEETLALKEKVLGREHPSRIKTLAEFASYYRFMGDPEPAEKLLVESFAMARRVLGDAHPDTRKISSWVSGLYLRTGRTELQREFLVGVLKQDPGNQHALEHLAGFLDFATLSPLMPDGEDVATAWKYTMTEPDAGWETEEFDDSSWSDGRAPFGNATPPGFRTKWDGRTIWLRREFELGSVPKGRLVLRLLQDDNSLVFINGVVALERQSWTGRRRLQIYALADGARALKPGRNVVAIRADNIDGEGVIDLGIFLETIPESDDNPVAAVGP